MDIRVAADPIAAAELAAAHVARRIRSAAARRQRVGIAVSGGATPALMFAALAELALPWAQLDVYQVDERVAPDGDPARNRALLDVLPIPRRQIFAMPVTVADLRRGAARYASSLPTPIDLVHLGMGDDGHTASWPPDDPVATAPGDVGITAAYRGHVRMTLTARAVNRARSRLVLVTGTDKAAAMAGWLLGDRSLPIQHVRRTNTTIVVDQAAAVQLAPHRALP